MKVPTSRACAVAFALAFVTAVPRPSLGGEDAASAEPVAPKPDRATAPAVPAPPAARAAPLAPPARATQPAALVAPPASLQLRARRQNGITLILVGSVLTIGGTALMTSGAVFDAVSGGGGALLGIGVPTLSLGQALICVGIPMTIPPRDAPRAAENVLPQSVLANPASIAANVARQRRFVLGSGIALGLSAALVIVGAILLINGESGVGAHLAKDWVPGAVMLPVGAAGFVVSATILAVSGSRLARARALQRQSR